MLRMGNGKARQNIYAGMRSYDPEAETLSRLVREGAWASVALRLEKIAYKPDEVAFIRAPLLSALNQSPVSEDLFWVLLRLFSRDKSTALGIIRDGPVPILGEFKDFVACQELKARPLDPKMQSGISHSRGISGLGNANLPSEARNVSIDSEIEIPGEVKWDNNIFEPNGESLTHVKVQVVNGSYVCGASPSKRRSALSSSSSDGIDEHSTLKHLLSISSPTITPDTLEFISRREVFILLLNTIFQSTALVTTAPSNNVQNSCEHSDILSSVLNRCDSQLELLRQGIGIPLQKRSFQAMNLLMGKFAYTSQEVERTWRNCVSLNGDLLAVNLFSAFESDSTANLFHVCALGEYLLSRKWFQREVECLLKLEKGWKVVTSVFDFLHETPVISFATRLLSTFPAIFTRHGLLVSLLTRINTDFGFESAPGARSNNFGFDNSTSLDVEHVPNSSPSAARCSYILGVYDFVSAVCSHVAALASADPSSVTRFGLDKLPLLSGFADARDDFVLILQLRIFITVSKVFKLAKTSISATIQEFLSVWELVLSPSIVVKDLALRSLLECIGFQPQLQMILVREVEILSTLVSMMLDCSDESLLVWSLGRLLWKAVSGRYAQHGLEYMVTSPESIIQRFCTIAISGNPCTQPSVRSFARRWLVELDRLLLKHDAEGCLRSQLLVTFPEWPAVLELLGYIMCPF